MDYQHIGAVTLGVVGGVGRGRWEGGDTVIPLWKHGKWVLFWQGVPHYVLSGRQFFWKVRFHFMETPPSSEETN